MNRKRDECRRSIIAILFIFAICSVFAAGVSFADDSSGASEPLSISYDLQNTTVSPVMSDLNTYVENIFTLTAQSGFYLPAIAYLDVSGDVIDGCVYDPSAGTFTIPAHILDNYITPTAVATLHVYAVPNGQDGNKNGYTVDGNVLYIAKGTDGSGVLGPFTGDYNIKNIGGLDLTGVTEIEICTGITQIGSYAFKAMDGITTVDVADTVSAVGSYAFMSCTSLSSVELSEEITVLPDYVFDSCTDMQGITLYEGLTQIGEFAFHNTGLEQITIPSTVTDIDSLAFASSSDLKKVFLLPNAVPSGMTSDTFNHATEIIVNEGKGTLYRTAFPDISEKIYETVPIPTAASGLLYDGTEKTGVSDSRIIFTNNKATDAGTYTAAAVPDYSNLYIWGDGSKDSKDIEWSIAERSITLTSGTRSKVYDGIPLTDHDITVSGDGFAECDTVTFTVTGYQMVAGESPNSFTYALGEGVKSTNYIISQTVGTLTVDKIATPITITTASDSKPYDGTPLSNSGYEFTQGVIIATDILNVTVYGSITEVGSLDNAISSFSVMNGDIDVTGSYTFNDYVRGKLTISKRIIVMTSGSASKVYDKTPLTCSDISVTGDGFLAGQGASYDIKGTITNAGSIYNEFSFMLTEGTSASNYDITKITGLLTVENLPIDVPAELYYKETGKMITFNIPESEWYTVENKARAGRDPGRYTYKLTLNTNCVWNPSTFNGNYNVYITLIEQKHVNTDGKIDIVVSSDSGVRADYTLVVTAKDDVSDIKSKYDLGNAAYAYDIKFMKDSSEVAPRGPLTINMLIPDNVSGSSFGIVHIHGDSHQSLNYTINGKYATITVDDLSDFVFVINPVNEKDYVMIVAVVIAVLAAVGIIGAVVLIRKSKHDD